jgi:hypothetical protein
MLQLEYHSLACHPAMPADSIMSVKAACDISTQRMLRLRYHINISKHLLVVSDKQVPERTDNLWETTCFEVFLAAVNKQEYMELNLSPSTRWAAYQFSEYREGRMDLALSTAPEIHIDMRDSHFALEANVQLPPEFEHSVFAIGMAVVAEESSGRKSYWALKHQKSEPDFHDRSCFTLKLEAPR